MKPRQHIMVDLETMGAIPGSVIASIGAVSFDPVAGVLGRDFYRTVNIVSAQAAGLTIDADTVRWWLRQDGRAQQALFEAEAGLAEVLQAFSQFYAGESGSVLWGHGASFDPVLLEGAYRAVQQRPPWKFWDHRCTRTIFDLAGVKPDRAAGVHHNALDDARAQADAVCVAYSKLGLAAPTPADPQ